VPQMHTDGGFPGNLTDSSADIRTDLILDFNDVLGSHLCNITLKGIHVCIHMEEIIPSRCTPSCLHFLGKPTFPLARVCTWVTVQAVPPTEAKKDGSCLLVGIE